MAADDSEQLIPAKWLEQDNSDTENRLTLAPKIRLHSKARSVLGVVQVPTDFNMDIEAAELVRKFPGVELRMQKLKSSNMLCTTNSFTEKGEERIADAASVFQPPGYLSIIGLGCTSMSFVLGAEAVDSAFKAAQPGTLSTDTARAQVAAIRAVLGKNKHTVALLTPYISSVHRTNVDMLVSNGFDVVSSASMGIVASEYTSQISKSTILDYVVELANNASDANAIVIGCTAFRVTTDSFIDEIEKIVGKPVITSTQAFFWHMLRQSGIMDKIEGYGHLFRCD